MVHILLIPVEIRLSEGSRRLKRGWSDSACELAVQKAIMKSPRETKNNPWLNKWLSEDVIFFFFFRPGTLIPCPTMTSALQKN